MTQSMETRTAPIDAPMVQLVISHLKDQNFAAYIHQVSEVLRHTKVTPIPDSPDFIAGISNFHGEMAIVIDLQRYFCLSNKPNNKAKHIIVSRRGKELYGLLVDEVSEIIRVPQTSISSAPALIQQLNNDYIGGVYTESKGGIIMLLDLEKILSQKQLAMMSKKKQKHFNNDLGSGT